MIRSRRGGRRHLKETAELNITAFMNLMVILVPFLLITAVFSRLAILELNLPGSSTEPVDPQDQVFQLEVIVRQDKIEVGDRNQGLLGIYPNSVDGYDYTALADKLVELKERYPEKTDASILLEQDIAYDTLVQVMDTVRVAQVADTDADQVVRSDLFPDISIGDAPVSVAASDGGYHLMVKSGRAKRMEKHHKRNKGSVALNLVSLMDIFTILVFFLLVNSSDVQTLPNAKDMTLPESIAEKKPEETVMILIGKTDILVQGSPVARIDEVMAEPGNEIPALRDALLSQNDRVLRRETQGDIAGREVTIMGDKDIPYRLLKKVMKTCTDADYGQISLAVLQKSSDKLDDLQASR